MEWSRPVIALFSLAIFAVAFWVAWINKDTQTFSILVGAIVSLVSSVAGYYFGSSVGLAEEGRGHPRRPGDRAGDAAARKLTDPPRHPGGSNA